MHHRLLIKEQLHVEYRQRNKSAVLSYIKVKKFFSTLSTWMAYSVSMPTGLPNVILTLQVFCSMYIYSTLNIYNNSTMEENSLILVLQFLKVNKEFFITAYFDGCSFHN